MCLSVLVDHPPTHMHTHTHNLACTYACHTYMVLYGFENRISECSKKDSVNSTRDNFDNFIHEACCVSGEMDWAWAGLFSASASCSDRSLLSWWLLSAKKLSTLSYISIILKKWTDGLVTTMLEIWPSSVYTWCNNGKSWRRRSMKGTSMSMCWTRFVERCPGSL